MTYEELEQSLDKYETYHYKDVLEAYESGEYNAIDRVLEIISDMQTDIQSQLTITVDSKANIEWECLEEAKKKIKAYERR